MKKITVMIVMAIAATGAAGCATTPKTQKTSLEIQAVQSKEFEASKSIVFASVLSVFQDLGYIVSSADKDTGFITAASPAGNKTNFFEALGGVSSSGQTKATAFIEEIRPGHATVRLNFVDTKNSSSIYGQSSASDKPILDPKVYQSAFAKIGDAVFIRGGGTGN